MKERKRGAFLWNTMYTVPRSNE